MRRAVLALALLAAPAAAHDRAFTPAQNAWLNRQVARDGMKCCDETDAHVGLAVEWRIVGGGYQVRLGGAWVAVPPGRLMRPRLEDPSPFGAQALLFHSPQGLIWCFLPEPLM